MRTIRRWRLQGMPMSWQVIEGQRTRVVTEEVLLAHWRLHMTQNPVHQQRMRSKQKATATEPMQRLAA